MSRLGNATDPASCSFEAGVYVGERRLLVLLGAREVRAWKLESAWHLTWPRAGAELRDCRGRGRRWRSSSALDRLQSLADPLCHMSTVRQEVSHALVQLIDAEGRDRGIESLRRLLAPRLCRPKVRLKLPSEI